MKVLFLTISDQQCHPLNEYSDLHRTYDFISWEAGFKAILSDVCIFDYYKSFVANGPFGMESSILKLVQENNIQLIIIPNLYYELAPIFLSKLRNVGCRSLIVFFDDSMRFYDTSCFYLSAGDYFLTHDSRNSKSLYKRHGIDAEYFPLYPSHSFFREIITRIDKAAVKVAGDVVFVGAKIADRGVFIDYLKDNGINVNVYGKGWDVGMLTTEEMLAAYKFSKISLNFIKTIDGSGRFQLKARLFEIIMAGGFVLSEHNDELAEYFDIGHEIDTFRSPDELLDKIKFYLEKSELRMEMQTRAARRVHKSYSFESNWRRYLRDIETGKIKISYPDPDYKVPTAAINSFFNWNFSFIYGRLMLKDYRLAYQQYRFCRRELKGIAGNDTAAINLLIKWALLRIMVKTVNRILKRNQINRIRQVRSLFKEMLTSKTTKRRVMAKLANLKKASSLEDKEALLHVMANRVYEFIEKRKTPGKDFAYLFSENSRQPTLYSSAYACMTLSILGRLRNLTADQKLRWLEYFNGFQNKEDGLFYDPVVDSPLFRSADWWGMRHLALHMISAYNDLGGKPKYPFRFLRDYYHQAQIEYLIDSVNWSSSILHSDDIDNKIMNIGCLLQYQRDAWGDQDAGTAVTYLQEYLREKINHETGMWGAFAVQDPTQRSRMVQFAYHLFPLFFYDKMPIQYPEKVVEIVLATQNSLGGFGVKLNSSACEDIDSIDILIRLAPYVPKRKEEIDQALKKAIGWILCNQVTDGGFVFRLNEALEYGHRETSSEKNKGSMFPTWFRTLSVVYLLNYFKNANEFIITNCPGYEFSY